MLIGGVVIWLVGGGPPPEDVSDWPQILIQTGIWRPILAYKGLIEGAFGSPQALSETAVWATPYIFAGLAVAFAFKGGLFNIGAEGQLALGALFAAWVGFALPKIIGPLPAFVHVPLAILGGALAGAVWGAIPGWLKARTGAHEVINTIMMNYIALLLAGYLLNGPWKDPNPFNVVAQTPAISRQRPFGADLRGASLPLGSHPGAARGGRRLLAPVDDDPRLRDSHGGREPEAPPATRASAWSG